MPKSPLLQLLETWASSPSFPTGGDIYEYRFILSGCAFNGDLEGDYTKATFGGLLLQEPFPIWKVGHSYDEYPQELAAWIKVQPVTREQDNVSSTDTPHELAADELAALLTLYLRRFVAVAGTTSVSIPNYYAKAPLPSPMPLPIVLKSREARVWPRLPLTVIYGPGGPKYQDNNAEDVPVSPAGLRDYFARLAKHPDAARIINAVQLYHRALENIFRHPDVSYLLLVCAAEAVGSSKPENRTEQEILELPAAKNVAALAQTMGLGAGDIRKLAIASVPDPKKSLGQMFREFLARYGVGHEKNPPLFNSQLMDLFKVTDEKDAISKAYGARSGYVHAARPYDGAALVGTSTGISPEVFFDVMIGNEKAPSILWLERMVAHSIMTYLTSDGKDHAVKMQEKPTL